MKIKTLTYPSVLLLILVNSIPIFGIIFLKWDIFSILFLYWLETIVIGFFNVLKMYTIEREKSISLIIFFMIHYLGFNFIHLLFIINLFAPDNIFIGSFFSNILILIKLLNIVVIALIPLFISHGISLFFNFFKEKEYLQTSLIEQMKMPYKRVIIMHIIIILSGSFIINFKESTVAIILLVVLKILFDIFGHIKEHYKSIKKVKKI